MQLQLSCAGLVPQPQRRRVAAAWQNATAGTFTTAGQLQRPKLRGGRQQLLPQHHKTVQCSAILPVGAEHLLADSTIPVLKIVLCCCVGAACAKQGMIDLQARRALSHLAINVFTPALMITKLGAHIDMQQALALWPIGANVIICHLVGLAMGVLHTKVLPTPAHLTKIIQVSTAISNVGNLPLVMVMSFVKNPNLPFNTATEAELAISYVMLGWFYATMLQMPLGHWLLHKDECKSKHSAAPTTSLGQQPLKTAAALAATGPAAAASSTSRVTLPATAPTYAAASAVPAVTISNNIVPLSRITSAAGVSAGACLEAVSLVGATTKGTSIIPSSNAAAPLSDVSAEAAAAAGAGVEALAISRLISTTVQLYGVMHMERIWPSQQLTMQHGGTTSSSTVDRNSYVGSGGSSGSAGDGLSLNHYTSGNGSSGGGACADGLPQGLAGLALSPGQLSKWDNIIHGIKPLAQDLQPLLKGIVSAPLIAGLVAIAIGSCPPLREALLMPGGSLSLIGDCLDMLGQPLIPVLLLVLGANLAAGPGPGNIPTHSALVVVATRLVLLPLLGCAAVLTAQRTGLISMQDPLTLVVMMVAWSTPTAILVHSLASVHRNGEDEVSALLYWEYLACIITLPLCSAAYLYLLGCCMSYAA